MSFVSPITTPAAQIAGSAAGAQRREGVSDRAAEAGAEQRIASDRQDVAARSLGDVGQMDGSADRDADGWRDDSPGKRTATAAPGEIADSPGPSRAADASGERGTRLDLDA
jgi:hypothetical protein